MSFGALGVAAAQVTYQDLLKPDPANWLTYSGSFDSQRHTSLKQIHTKNVKSLVPKWIYHVPGASRLETVPLVSNGVMYISQPNEVYAIDAQAGRLLWEYHHEPAIEKGPNRGVALYGNSVYFGTPDAHLVALDARSGSLLWKVKLAESRDGYWCPVAPLAIKDKVIVGIAPGRPRPERMAGRLRCSNRRAALAMGCNSEARSAWLGNVGRGFLEDGGWRHVADG